MWIDFHQASQSFRTLWRTARSCRFAAWHLAVPFSERSATMVRRASCPLVLGLVSSMVSRTDEVKGETHTKVELWRHLWSKKGLSALRRALHVSCTHAPWVWEWGVILKWFLCFTSNFNFCMRSPFTSKWQCFLGLLSCWVRRPY